ncbi:hypothetical protein FHY18_002550 [Xanthomonas arboricola]|nr:hypothetical protein [Xanthomonas sp. 3793]
MERAQQHLRVLPGRGAPAVFGWRCTPCFPTVWSMDVDAAAHCSRVACGKMPGAAMVGVPVSAMPGMSSLPILQAPLRERRVSAPAEQPRRLNRARPWR